MKVEIPITLVKGKIVDNKQKVADHFTSLDDGTYILTIQSINPLTTTRDYQNAYFAMVDICVSSSGNARYIIHDSFKAAQGVASTTNFTVQDWKTYIEKFKFWAYDKMDVIV